MITTSVIATTCSSRGLQLFVSNWILATGVWNDNGVWDDNAFWID